MATHTGSEGTIKVSSTTVGELRSYSLEQTADTIEDTSMGDTNRTYKSALKGWSGSASLFFDEAEALADRVAVINKGIIVEISTPTELGGRATSQATVQWRDGDQIKSEKTDNPTSLVSTLSARFNGEVPELMVTRPSLEDIYLEMIGGVDEKDS